MAVYTTVFVGSTPVGGLLIGALASALGVAVALAIGGAACVVIGAVAFAWLGRIREREGLPLSVATAAVEPTDATMPGTP